MGVPALTRLRAVMAAAALAPLLSVAFIGVTAAASSAADADINIVGGAADSSVVCGNVAEAQTLAARQHLTLQRSRCNAKADGGSVNLHDVEITLPRSGGNGDDDVLARMVGGATASVAVDTCARHRLAASSGGRQLNECSSNGHGGQPRLDNVTLVSHRGDGSTSSRKIGSLAVALPQSGGAGAECHNVNSDPGKLQDNCDGSGVGGVWNLHNVDVVSRNADGTSSTRHGINVVVRGGDAKASIYCFNVVDGANRVVQVNICKAAAQAGDATLSNVTVHVYS
ncbi:hypothetical protein [Frankia sp. AgKG'84/4]|uniref:hypothetical protein n=1 Tax=Frankia sp. AgKG'84/4 TaxID=573490 RepID=UPI00200E4137|nr:hypothetical protein [Frankia sp. AgKG'84/4]MCL9796779.1 hypothetical protein [Frankia sp. AgKG'84/4]